jgi:MoaA/NifB/PqqE/SkfB family radical SAM enzyme
LYGIKDDYNKVIDQAIQAASRLDIQFSARRFYFDDSLGSNKCEAPFTECYILPNGDVAPCCFCGSFIIGNVYQTSFEEIWFGEMYQKLRKTRFLQACRHCMPFIPLDDYHAHFTAHFKETQEFKQLNLSCESAK